MERIESGKYVELVYGVYEITDSGDEKLVYEVNEEEPEVIISGVTHGVIAPLERALQGLKQGDQFNVFVNAGEGYGDFNSDLVIELDKSMFGDDENIDDDLLVVGNTLPMLTSDGMQVLGKILEVGPNSVKMDFNHPVAGKNIRFKGTVKTVRDATQEELNAQQGCCGCHGHDHDHDHGDCSCGSHCHC